MGAQLQGACLLTPVWMSPIIPKSMYASLSPDMRSRFPGCGSAWWKPLSRICITHH